MPARVGRTVAHRRNRNTRSGARRNITAHYDLGNDFYRLWLDETMTYSSAVFESPEQSLADAQRSKYRRMAELAGLERGQHVLEIGTGWGGFAMYAAGELGCRVTSVTISQAQHDLARERVAEAGLADLVDVQLRDYRDVRGHATTPSSPSRCSRPSARSTTATSSAPVERALKTGGRMSVQVITFPHDAYEAQLRGRQLDPALHLPGRRAALAGGHRSRRSRARQLLMTGPARHPRQLRTHAADVAQQLLRSASPRSVPWASTTASSACGTTTSRISEAGFRTGMTQDLQIAFEKRRGVA